MLIRTHSYALFFFSGCISLTVSALFQKPTETMSTQSDMHMRGGGAVGDWYVSFSSAIYPNHTTPPRWTGLICYIYIALRLSVLSRFVRDAATAAAREPILRIPSMWGKSAIMEGSWLQFDLEHLALVTGEF
jgi:hypothetical protein